MTPEIQNFAFEENLVRIVMRDNEPWFVGVDVCRALAIKNEHHKLATLDDDERADLVLNEGSSGKNGVRHSQEMIVVSEPGLYRLIFSSRKEEAERFKRWIAHDVLPSIRKNGFYAMSRDSIATGNIPENMKVNSSSPSHHGIDLIRVYRQMFGNEMARQLWIKIGLPHITTPSGPIIEGTDSANACLALLLSHKFMVDDVELTIRTELDNAFNGGICARDELEKLGIKIDTELDGFYLANRNIKLDWIFSGTAWENSRWNQTLKNLPGTMTGKKFYFAGKLSRCLFIPVDHLDYPAMVLN